MSAPEGKTDGRANPGTSEVDPNRTSDQCVEIEGARRIEVMPKRSPILIQPLGIAVFDYGFNLLH
jgi:hypothetical protein